MSTDSDDETVDWIFLACLVGVVANGAHDDWGQIYTEAKNGAAAIATLMIDDVMEAELKEVRDTHGR